MVNTYTIRTNGHSIELTIPIYQWEIRIPLVRMGNVHLPLVNDHTNGTNRQISLTNGENRDHSYEWTFPFTIRELFHQ